MVLILGNYGLIVALLGVYALYVAHRFSAHNIFFFRNQLTTTATLG
jgi:hypothetical protein